MTAAFPLTSALTTTDAGLIELPCGELWHRGPTTGGAWVRVPVDALADIARYVAVTV